jgi:hypothetical protein
VLLIERFQCGVQTTKILGDPFDYETEDKLIAAWKRGDIEACRSVTWSVTLKANLYFTAGKPLARNRTTVAQHMVRLSALVAKFRSHDALLFIE